MEKRWTILTADEEQVKTLQSQLKINPAICKILVLRGIEYLETAKKYFRPSLDELHDPWLMKDMDKAVERIIKAVNAKEKILVFGDYDVDGTTAVSCMYRFIKKFHSNLDFYIPHRYREGYGISKIGIDFAKENGFTLIISLDCGIKSVELIAYAKNLGIDFIVCDHHLPDDELPAAVAILNPKQKDCNYPYKELCGCGVGFKLITALAQHLSIEEEHYYCYIDLVAVAIAADIVPMTGENRILAYFGLEKINSDPNAGIKALIHLGNNQKKTVVFRDHWHKGVVGIVASRLIENYYRPTVVLTQSGDVAAGSARSVPGFNLYEAVHACREYLLGYGGHFAAAGLSLLPENVEAFANKFEEVVSATIPSHLLIPEIIIDAPVSFKEINSAFYSIICQMEPFGPEN